MENQKISWHSFPITLRMSDFKYTVYFAGISQISQILFTALNKDNLVSMEEYVTIRIIHF